MKRKRKIDDEPIKIYPAVRKSIIRSSAENKVALEFFRKYTTGKEVTHKLYPNATTKTTGCVSKVFEKLKEDYIETDRELRNKKNFKGSKYTQAINVYRINNKFLFDSFDDLHIKLTQKEKEFLAEIYDNPEAREVICELNAGENIFISAIKFYVLYYIIKQKGKQEEFKKRLDEKMLKIFEMPRIL